MMPRICDAENLGSSTSLLFLRAAKMTFRAFRPRYCASIPPLCAFSPAAQANHSWMFLLGHPYSVHAETGRQGIVNVGKQAIRRWLRAVRLEEENGVSR